MTRLEEAIELIEELVSYLEETRIYYSDHDKVIRCVEEFLAEGDKMSKNPLCPKCLLDKVIQSPHCGWYCSHCKEHFKLPPRRDKPWPKPVFIGIICSDCGIYQLQKKNLGFWCDACQKYDESI